MAVISKEKCRFFGDCSAPICLLEDNVDIEIDESTGKYADPYAHAVFYPDEEVCRAHPSRLEIRVQKKIAKKCKPENMGYYFNIFMLRQNPTVAQGIKGLDPNSSKGEEKQCSDWLEKHPPISEIMKDRGRKLAAGW